LADAKRHGVVVVAVTETPADFRRQASLLTEDRYLRPALGAHPLRVSQLRGREFESFFASLGQTDYVGEIGLDLSEAGRRTARRQFEVFERILGDTRVRSKVLTIHSRGAAKEVVDRMEQTSAVGIMHWYTGSLSVAERALAAGLYFSVNPSMVRSKRGKRLLQLLPKDRVLTETDGPYCRVGSRKSLPSDVVSVVEHLGICWGVPGCQAADVIADNMSRLYGQRLAS
jgi:TatD DNase family protein